MKSAAEDSSKGARGRRATFDRSEAIRIARNLFWQHGYDGVSIADLTGAIGIAAPSLYYAFGSKAGLYREALRMHVTAGLTSADIADAPSSIEAVRRLLEAGATAATAPDGPGGCMISSGMLTTSPENAALAREVKGLRAELRLAVERRIACDVDAGMLPPDTDTGSLSRFAVVVLQGMSVQAIDGCGRPDLQTVIETALTAFAAMSG